MRYDRGSLCREIAHTRRRCVYRQVLPQAACPQSRSAAASWCRRASNMPALRPAAGFREATPRCAAFGTRWRSTRASERPSGSRSPRSQILGLHGLHGLQRRRTAQLKDTARSSCRTHPTCAAPTMSSILAHSPRQAPAAGSLVACQVRSCSASLRRAACVNAAA